MSLAMVFRATDGLLVLADGREVAITDQPGVYQWQCDDSVKLFAAPDGTPLAVIAVGRVNYGDINVLDVVRSTFNDKPTTGLTWAPKTLARAVNARLSDLDSTYGNWHKRQVLALAVGYEPGTTEPQVRRFGVDPLKDIDYDEVDAELVDGKMPDYRYSALIDGDDLGFQSVGFTRIPARSAAGDVVWQDIDHQHRLDEAGADVDDPRYWASYQLADLPLDELQAEVMARMTRLIATDVAAFRQSQVGGHWTFVGVRPGSAPVVTKLALGPFEPSVTQAMVHGPSTPDTEVPRE